MSGLKKYTLSFLFLGILFFPLVNEQFNFVKDITSFENRRISPKPKLDVKLLDPFPQAYETYYNDTFNLRSRLIRYFSIYNCVILKKSPIPDKVIIGNNGWLYMAGVEMGAYVGKTRFTNEQLEAFKNELELKRKYLAERGCRFYFLIAPVKQTIHSENIRFDISRINSQSPGEQLIEYLNKNSNIQTVNVFEVLRREKKHNNVYHALDNHWNKLGAFFAANAFLETVHKDIPDVQPFRFNDMVVRKDTHNDGNINLMLGRLNLYKDYMYDVKPRGGFISREGPRVGYPVTEGFPYPWEYENVREIPGSKKPRLLIISDSFGGDFFPFASESFSRSVKIFDAWQYKLHEEVITSEHPDVYLLIIHEALLASFFNTHTTFLPKK